MKSRIILSRSLQSRKSPVRGFDLPSAFPRRMVNVFAAQPTTSKSLSRPLSSACESHNNDDHHHCSPTGFACGSAQHESDREELPPPLPEPTYSVHKRILPSSLTALSSPKGRQYLLETFVEETAESYWALTEQFVNQSEPAFCGITTLLMVLNAMSIDPGIRWRGGWRFYGSEDVLLDRCCFSAERIRRVGLNLDEFGLLGRCHGLNIEMKRPSDDIYTMDHFRQDIKKTLTDKHNKSILVVSFSRQHLNQTGDGHFSPIAVYHEKTDQVLILDVARFKYQPYFCSVTDLYNAMTPKDASTNQSRGWFLLSGSPVGKKKKQQEQEKEDRRPAELGPKVGDGDTCPVGKVKIAFCQANTRQYTSRS